MPATCRAPRRAVPPRQDGCRGALGREALDAATVASGAGIKPGEPTEALHREARGARCRAALLDVPCRRAGTDAGGALGRKALDASAVASGARLGHGEPGEALHREALGAPVTCRSACPAASCPGRRRPIRVSITGPIR